ncbi:glycosyltransferase [Mesorhizobium sp. INR15]|uniref:glycosyltransferase n=1 Tax=Mesorhizobium sp. INR15 TaxID=2654248 RepID=UPI0021565122|nr:glycosyltransferase [Mesorhizobium sp. INR15]
MLAWPDKALSGIPRVEDFLIKAALADPDRHVRVVAFKSWDGGFRSLEPFEERRLADGQIAPLRVTEWPGRKAALKSAFQMVRLYPWAKRAADSHLAQTVTNGSGGFDWAAVKLLIRLYRLYRRAAGRTGRRQAAARPPQRIDNDITLICHNVLAYGDGPAVSDDASGIAFICHDLIPSVRPDLVAGTKAEKEFGTKLAQLMRAGATAFCASDAASVMLTDHMRQAGIAPPVVHRFPMPSVLHETASRLGMTSRIETSEPFALYCSTIEVRKNHILLARIWQQAREEGVTLPKLVCAGRWGWMIDPLRAYLKAHPDLAETVTFTGPISDEELIRYYRSASFGVFPSHIEGWGYAASECLDFGIPVIVSTTPALIEASGGLMPAIDSEDQAGWYAAIRRMADDKAWHSSLVDRIARHHRPTPAAASWAAIKTGLQAIGKQ